MVENNSYRNPRRPWKVVAVVAGGVAALLVVVGAAVLVRGLGGGTAEQALTQVDRSDSPVALPELVVLAEEAEPLPAEGAVGHGAILSACSDCDPQLVLADGERFMLSIPGTAVLSYSLSPDGRWLTLPDASAAIIRELTGDAVHRLEVAAGRGLAAWVWSPDSRFVLFAELPVPPSADDLPPTEYRLLDVTDGTETAVAGRPGREFVAVLPSGMLLALDPARYQGDAPVTEVEFQLVDPVSGETTGAVTVDAGDWLERGESLAAKAYPADPGGVELILAPDGAAMYLVVFGDGLWPPALLRTGRDGRVEQRVSLVGLDPNRIGWVAGQLGGAVVVAEAQATREVVTGYVTTLFTVADAGLVKLTTLEGAMAVRVAGTAVHGGSAF